MVAQIMPKLWLKLWPKLQPKSHLSAPNFAQIVIWGFGQLGSQMSKCTNLITQILPQIPYQIQMYYGSQDLWLRFWLLLWTPTKSIPNQAQISMGFGWLEGLKPGRFGLWFVGFGPTMNASSVVNCWMNKDPDSKSSCGCCCACVGQYEDIFDLSGNGHVSQPPWFHN